MPQYVEPNIEAVVSAYLRASSSITALVDDRVYTVLPAGAAFPALRVVLIGDVKVTKRPLWLYRAALQIDAWGGSKADAWAAAALAQAVLVEAEGTVGASGHIGAVDIGSLQDLPDDGYTPTRPRFMFTAEVTFHPAP